MTSEESVRETGRETGEGTGVETTTMDPGNAVVQLCARGMAAEAGGRTEEARGLFLTAWEAATDDYEACVAAHYLARHQRTPRETLHWNRECLTRADRVGDERVRPFYASLHGAMGRAHLDLGDVEEARTHFASAARHLSDVPPGQYRDWVRLSVARGLRAVGGGDGGDGTEADPVHVLLVRLCARADLDALSLLLPVWAGSLGTAEDEEAVTTALRMLHAERRLPDAEQAALSEAIGARSA
ncbi:hypothetical protein GCM10009654_46540 [Streptomyces hebeiensis]|uniref:Tetratricopeptide repeat protein n=1 Tax=Streptomyces hebeiensis TaxID=229486 RepID=A0ABN1UZQ6_9ACTN